MEATPEGVTLQGWIVSENLGGVMAPPYVLIDNCALNWLYTGYAGKDLSQDQVDLARDNLERAADEDRVRVFMTNPLLEEIAGCWHNEILRPKFEVLVNGLARLAKSRFLRLPVRIDELPTVPGRIDDEAAARRPLKPKERFFLPWVAEQVVRVNRENTEDVVAQAGEKAYRAKLHYRDDEVARRQRVMGEASTEQLKQWRQQWIGASSEVRHAIVDDWVLSVMEKNRIEWGLPKNSHWWPNPRQFRSTWFERAYTVARLIEVLPTGKLDGSDLYDAAYYSDAAYADVLVTTDAGLLRRAHAIQAPGLRAVHLREWLREWLG